VCTSTDARDKRLRCAILLETEHQTVVVDAGPDFRQQMLRAGVMRLDAVLLTHLHKDHIAGLDDVRAYNFKHNQAMDIYADELTIEQVKREFPYVFDGTNYPGIPKFNIHAIDAQPFLVNQLQVTPVRVLHHKLPVNGFRFGNFAYVTDASYIPAESMQKLHGLDVLILNALRKEKHISHFNLEEALEVVHLLKPKRTYLTHISHLMGTHAHVERELPPHVHIAYDGLTFEVAV
jgi:phosphoribosyl 1,2-cyclic phosphate phosphodiesterase